MTDLVLEILGGWIRAALMALTAYLVEHHVVTASQGDRLTSELFTYVMLALPGLGALAWTTWQKYRSYLKLTAAREAVSAIQAVQKSSAAV